MLELSSWRFLFGFNAEARQPKLGEVGLSSIGNIPCPLLIDEPNLREKNY